MLRLIFFLFLIIWHLYLKCFDYFSIFFNFNTFNNHSIYDFIIVGSGTAGSTIAHRLSQNTNSKILVIEAGSHAPWFINIPVVGPFLQQSAFDWEYSTVPQQMACKALKKQQSNWPMGKLVGGTSWFNNLLHVRGIKEDYDNWFRDYNNYNYERDILYYFKKFESTLKLSNQIHSTISDDVLKAAEIIGINSSKIKATISESGTRWTTSHNLLTNRSPNLHLITKSTVTKLLIDKSNGIVSGIELINSYNEILIVWINKAVILTAGVIGTPKLLQLSGIGPKSILEQLQIQVISDLPVGNNLQDHVTTGLDLIILDTPPINRFDLNTMISPSSLFQYLFYNKGPFRSIGCEMNAFIKTDLSKEIPDLQLMVVPTGATVDYGVFFKHIFKITEKTWSTYFYKLYNNYTISILPVILHPKSKGYVHIKSKNPLDKPLINPNYLSEQDDVNTLLKGIEIIQKLIQTEPMQKLGARIVSEKINGCQTHKFNTSEYWTCYIRHLTLTAYHPVGTCKLGHRSDPSTVIDYNFRVHGLKNLYVADASVMPSLPSGNIHAAVGMIAEKVADIVQLSHASICGVQNVERICSFKSIFFTSL